LTMNRNLLNHTFSVKIQLHQVEGHLIIPNLEHIMMQQSTTILRLLLLNTQLMMVRLMKKVMTKQ